MALRDIVADLRGRGVASPVLLRFGDVLQDRIEQLWSVFDRSMTEHRYTGGYRCVYPVKVNQQRHVVEEVLRFGRRFGFGLEAGSKPELLAVLALVDDEHTPIICNGFKDHAYLEAVVLASKLGRHITPVIEKFSELETLAQIAQHHGVEPRLGLRVKLGSGGAGRWQASGGERSKFGLFVSEVLDAVSLLRDAGLLGGLKMLHAHVGSQITDIRSVKTAVTELARVYVELCRMGVTLDALDVGGGLAVNYTGGGGSAESSMNYGLQEYANDVVYHVQSVCDQAGVPHPALITESGRAITAHHSVLVMSVTGWTGFGRFTVPESLDAQALQALPGPVRTLAETYMGLAEGNAVESFHDAQTAREEVQSLFNLGYCSLAHRGLAQRLYYGVCSQVYAKAREAEHAPAELLALEEQLCDTYFCNASIFQSLPDAWAIDQVFPVVPLDRLNEPPTSRGVLADVTCDSDGQLNTFIDPHDRDQSRRVLDLHPYTGEPYDLGVFLVGAYQETLGDLHNLFGDTNAVHVSLDEQGGFAIDEVVHGDTSAEVLSYVQFNPDVMRGGFHAQVRRAQSEGRLDAEEAKALQQFYDQSLSGYTYLT